MENEEYIKEAKNCVGNLYNRGRG